MGNRWPTATSQIPSEYVVSPRSDIEGRREPTLPQGLRKEVVKRQGGRMESVRVPTRSPVEEYIAVGGGVV